MLHHSCLQFDVADGCKLSERTLASVRNKSAPAVVLRKEHRVSTSPCLGRGTCSLRSLNVLPACERCSKNLNASSILIFGVHVLPKIVYVFLEPLEKCADFIFVAFYVTRVFLHISIKVFETAHGHSYTLRIFARISTIIRLFRAVSTFIKHKHKLFLVFDYCQVSWWVWINYNKKKDFDS